MSRFSQKNDWKDYVAILLVSLLAFVAGLFLAENVWKIEMPKTVHLKKENEYLQYQAGHIYSRIHSENDRLSLMRERDESVYRTVFGMPVFAKDSLCKADSAGFAGDASDKKFCRASELLRAVDDLCASIEERGESFYEIESVLKTADKMALSIPAICPVIPDRKKVYISSPFGRRFHPVLNVSRMHNGIDFSLKSGNSVYATGDATVEDIKVEMNGYGRQIILNHGFGYKTRYAHLKTIFVTEGMKVKRGDKIALSGNSGLTSGPHLHYEVIFKGRNVNPYNYFDRDIAVEQYEEMVREESDQDGFFIHPMHMKK